MTNRLAVAPVAVQIFASFPLKVSLLLLVLLATFASAVGCQPNEPIVRHRIPKSQSGLEELRNAGNPPTGHQIPSENPQPAQATEPTDRMVVALFKLDNATWFFKINGSIEDVKETESQWKPFLEAIKFVDGEPQYELPDGWTEGGKRPMRFATLKIGAVDPPLEMAISSLGPDQDLLLNVNRWRGQMGLKPISEAELSEDTSKLKSDAKSAVQFDVVGNFSGGMRAPFANRPDPPFAGGPGMQIPSGETNSDATSSTTTDNTEFRFDIPDDWESGRTSGMVPVRLQKTSGDKSAQITIVGLPADANEWEPNTKRWAGEIGLADLTEEELVSRTSEIEVDGTGGQLLKLISDDEATTKATIAGMVKRNGTAWFMKLTGDKEIVRKNEEVFDGFLRSLIFPK